MFRLSGCQSLCLNNTFLSILLLFVLVIFIQKNSMAYTQSQNPKLVKELRKEIEQELKRVQKEVYSNPEIVISQNKIIRAKFKGKLSPFDYATLIRMGAWSYINTNSYELALDKIEEINQLERPKNNSFDWTIYNTKGIIYWHLGQGEESLKYHLLAYQYIKDKPEHLSNRVFSESNLGYTFVQLGFYEQALPYLERVLTHFLKKDDQPRLAVAYNNLGEALFYLNKVDEAFVLHQKSLAIRIKHKLDFHASYSYHNLGLIHLKRKDYPSATKNLLKAIKLRVDSNYVRGVSESKLALAKVYLATNRHGILREILLDIIYEAKEHNQLEFLSKAHLLQSEFFQTLGQYNNALNAYKQYHSTLENVQLKKTDNQLVKYINKSSTIEKEVNILQLQKENEIQRLETDNQRQKANIVYTAGTVIVVLLSIFLWMLHLRRRKILLINNNLSMTLRDLKATQSKLIESEKMAGLGTLTAGIAHEINNPVNFTHVSLHNLREKHAQLFVYLKELAGGEEADEVVISSFTRKFKELDVISDTAEQGTSRIKAIVKDLNMFTRMDEAVKKNITLIEPIESTINLIETEYKNITFRAELDSKPKLECYPSRLSQVLMNVLINACHAINERIIGEPGHEGVIEISMESKDECVCIKITDNGCGMDEATKNCIYEPFFTTKDVGVGTGLGMAITFAIIKEHQGRIDVDSVLGEGTKLSIYLPS